MEIQAPTKKIASSAAYIGAVLFTVLIILFNIMPKNIVAISVVAVAFHVVLFPVVAALPSANWAKAGGYGWLSLDIAANVMLINGVDEHVCTSLRYGAHISAIIWIISASLKGNRLLQSVCCQPTRNWPRRLRNPAF